MALGSGYNKRSMVLALVPVGFLGSQKIYGYLAIVLEKYYFDYRYITISLARINILPVDKNIFLSLLFIIDYN
jgi:hypothetical protein